MSCILHLPTLVVMFNCCSLMNEALKVDSDFSKVLPLFFFLFCSMVSLPGY